ncbi:MAG TPA: protein-L-isoaspartate(D-aspartate) O-methyltransferase [Synergistaceae bacterium]|nr:protein-L-isoaspartate(D-aspartate) O-methyltransferase [Synergistaceae bacterium]
MNEQLESMIRTQIEARGVRDPRVLRALGRVDRGLFVPPEARSLAYEDFPLSIGYDQTISQPYMVAIMTELLSPSPSSKILEIGTGCGYQTAILAEMARKVYSLEIIPELAESARQRLASLGYDNVVCRSGNGWQGWPSEAPFDGILLAAAPEELPQRLVEQLAPGGRLVLPVGTFRQELVVVDKDFRGNLECREIFGVRFVHMTGKEAPGISPE